MSGLGTSRTMTRYISTVEVEVNNTIIVKTEEDIIEEEETKPEANLPVSVTPVIAGFDGQQEGDADAAQPGSSLGRRIKVEVETIKPEPVTPSVPIHSELDVSSNLNPPVTEENPPNVEGRMLNSSVPTAPATAPIAISNGGQQIELTTEHARILAEADSFLGEIFALDDYSTTATSTGGLIEPVMTLTNESLAIPIETVPLLPMTMELPSTSESASSTLAKEKLSPPPSSQRKRARLTPGESPEESESTLEGVTPPGILLSRKTAGPKSKKKAKKAESEAGAKPNKKAKFGGKQIVSKSIPKKMINSQVTMGEPAPVPPMTTETPKPSTSKSALATTTSMGKKVSPPAPPSSQKKRTRYQSGESSEESDSEPDEATPPRIRPSQTTAGPKSKKMRRENERGAKSKPKKKAKSGPRKFEMPVVTRDRGPGLSFNLNAALISRGTKEVASVSAKIPANVLAKCFNMAKKDFRFRKH